VSGPEQAREIVWDYITSAGLVPSEDRIAELLPLARVWPPAARRVAIKLVAAGQRPTRAAVEAATRQLITENKRATDERRAEADAVVAARGPDAATWVLSTAAIATPTVRPAMVRARSSPCRPGLPAAGVDDPHPAT
jgi:hypothetical protein